MVLWKDKQNWEGLSEFPKNSERPQINKFEMKKKLQLKYKGS